MLCGEHTGYLNTENAEIASFYSLLSVQQHSDTSHLPMIFYPHPLPPLPDKQGWVLGRGEPKHPRLAGKQTFPAVYRCTNCT